MKHAIAFSLGAVIAFSGCQKKDAPASGSAGDAAREAAIPATPPAEGELVITAELTEIPGAFPANDLYNYAYIMKYKVLKVVKGQYTDPDILVGHYNPRIGRNEIADDQKANVGGKLKSFKVGDVHYLVLNPLDKTWTGAIEDDYYKDRRPRYWARWVDPL